MIKIRPYKHTDRYLFENMIKDCFLEKKMDPPESQKIIDTIGFYTTFPQTGKIFIISYNNNVVGYAIIIYQWKIKYGGITIKIEEYYINKNFRKYKIETNLIEYLIKEEKVFEIEIKLDDFKSISKKIFTFFNFNRDYNPVFVKVI